MTNSYAPTIAPSHESKKSQVLGEIVGSILEKTAESSSTGMAIYWEQAEQERRLNQCIERWTKDGVFLKTINQVFCLLAVS